MNNENDPEDTDKRVVINYTNYKNETAERCILPKLIWFGANEWHPKPQWLLDAIDLDRKVERTFALAMVHSWRSAATMSEAGEPSRGG